MKEPHSNLSELNGNALKSAGVPLSFAFKHPFSPLVNTLKGIRLFVKLSVSREKMVMFLVQLLAQVLLFRVISVQEIWE